MPMNDDELSRLIGDHATRHVASDALRARLRHAAAQGWRPSQSQPTAPPHLPQRTRRPRPWPWRALANGWGTWIQPARLGSAIAGLLLGVGLTLGLQQILGPEAGLAKRWAAWHAPAQTQAPLGEQLLSDHLDALRSAGAIEVASSDRHTVKPWFEGRLPYAPPVQDLSAQGYVLLGARLRTLGGTRMAVLVYGHRHHLVDVYVWPAQSAALPQPVQRLGYSVQAWQTGEWALALVSDMDAPERDGLASAWRAALARLTNARPR